MNEPRPGGARREAERAAFRWIAGYLRDFWQMAYAVGDG